MKNIDGSEIKLKTVKKKKRKTKPKNKFDPIGKKVHYIGKTKATGQRIVFYEGVVLGEKGDKYTVEFVDRNIYTSDEPFVIDVPKRVIHFD